MSSFSESNTVEAMIRDLLCGAQPASPKGVADLPAPYIPTGLAHRGAGWHYVPAAALPRQPQDVFVEAFERRVTSPARATKKCVLRDWLRPVPGTYWPRFAAAM